MPRRLETGDLVLLREVLGYMERRIFDPSHQERLRRVTVRVEDALLTSGGPGELALDRDEARTLAMTLESYSEELSRPGSDVSNRPRVARMREMIAELGPSEGRFRGLRLWFRRLLGR